MLPLLKHHVSHRRESNCNFTHHSVTLIRNPLKINPKNTKPTLETNPPRPYREPVRILIESFFKPKP